MGEELVRPGRECRKCGENRRSRMVTSARSTDGHAMECKACDSAGGKEWYAANRERHYANGKAWAEANPERVRELRKAWADANIEKVRERARAYRAANPEKGRAWRAANPERHALNNRIQSSRRRARETDAGSFTRDEFLAVCEQADQWVCAVCSGPAEHIDHIIPIARGGANEVENLQWLCAPCNRSKGARRMSEWLPGRLSELAKETE